MAPMANTDIQRAPQLCGLVSKEKIDAEEINSTLEALLQADLNEARWMAAN